jgi:hypothetical protein
LGEAEPLQVDADVAGEDDHVGVGLGQAGGRELDVQVAEDVELHRGVGAGCSLDGTGSGSGVARPSRRHP